MSISLPLETESTRCSDFARLHDIDPGGTALAPDVIVLAEIEEPWPKPVAKHPDLTDLVAAAAGRPERIRLLGAVPSGSGRDRLIAFRPTTGGMFRSEVDIGVDPAHDLRTLLDPENSTAVTGVSAARTVLVAPRALTTFAAARSAPTSPMRSCDAIPRSRCSGSATRAVIASPRPR